MRTSSSRSRHRYASSSGDSKRKNRSGRRSQSCSNRRMRRCRSGVKTNNPFLNYLRVFRRKHCGWPQRKVAKEGAKCWCKMNSREKQKFYDEACLMRRKVRKRTRRNRRGCRPRRRRSRSCRPMRTSRREGRRRSRSSARRRRGHRIKKC